VNRRPLQPDFCFAHVRQRRRFMVVPARRLSILLGLETVLDLGQLVQSNAQGSLRRLPDVSLDHGLRFLPRAVATEA
jgi:hypothetical protein